MTEAPLLLALDFGQAKVGVAIGSMVPAKPLEVIRYKSEAALLQHLQQIVESEQPQGIIIGWPADHLTEATRQTESVRRFGEKVGELTGLPVIYYPETLTTQSAMTTMRLGGIAKHKRRLLEDSYAAAAILDSYLISLA